MPCVGCSTSSQWAQVIYFAGFIVIFQFGWAAVQVSHLSLIPVLAHDERSRTELTALRYVNISVYLTVVSLLALSHIKKKFCLPKYLPVDMM